VRILRGEEVLGRVNCNSNRLLSVVFENGAYSILPVIPGCTDWIGRLEMDSMGDVVI